jgi:hypothetical protein
MAEDLALVEMKADATDSLRGAKAEFKIMELEERRHAASV